MIKNIKKRDGRIEEFQPSKVNKWGEWASKTLGKYVDWSSVVLHAVSTCPETCSSQLLQERLIKTCLENDSWSYNRMAGRLYAAYINKQLYEDGQPTVKELHRKLQNNGLMKYLAYSDEEYDEIEKIIDHKRDFKAAHFEIEQVRKKYALRNRVTGQEYETQQFVYMRMAMALSEDQPKERRLEDVKNFYELFSLKKINAPTPNYINLGTPHNGLASCVIYKSGDSAASLAVGDHIAYTMTYMSAGIGSYIETRSVNDSVRGGAIKHQGKLPYFRALDGAVHANLQAGRGGACTTYFSAFDPEVNDITRLKNPMSTKDKQIRGLDYAMIQNKFFAKKVAKNEDIFLFNVKSAPDLMKAMFSGTPEEFAEVYEKYENDDSFKKEWVNAREILISQRNEAYETGKGYLFWADEVNRHTPHKDRIHSSNLCVAPETMVLTEFGNKPIAEMEGEEVSVWNGEEFSLTKIVKTGEDQKILKVETDSGYSLECTPYHKWYIFTGYGRPYKEVRTHELEAGDKLMKFDLPVIEGDKDLDRAYENGFYSGNGCFHRGTQIIYLYHEKRELINEFNDVSWVFQDDQKRILGRTSGLKDKFFVPTDDYSIDSKLTWLAGFLDADGCVYRNGTNEQLTASSVDMQFLSDIQLMLQTLGVSSKVVGAAEEGFKPLPLNDGSGMNGSFYCQKLKRLLITSNDTQKLLELGLNLKRLTLEKRTPQRDAKRFVRVESVVDEGRIDDTFCLNEPKRHMAVFNGILTGQCLEVALPTEAYESMADLYSTTPIERKSEVAMCNLGGIVVANIADDEEYAKACYYSLLMIDKTIHLADYPLPNVGVTAKSRLNAGVGIIGLAHHMAKKHLPYSSDEGKQEVDRVAERHAYHVINASLELSKELGVAPWMHRTKWPEGWLPIDTYNRKVDDVVPFETRYDWEDLRSQIVANGGIRNSSLMNHMPSESSSKASGTTNGLYPVRELTLMKTDLNNVIYWAAPEGEKLERWYESVWDIDTKHMIDTYAIVQKWTDQAISADLYRKIVGSDVVTTNEMISDYLYMTKMGMKTQYYVNSYTSNTGTTNTEDADSCESCTL